MYKVILITSSNTRDRYDAVLETWGKHVDLYSFSDEEYKGTIKASNNVGYESHVEKTFFALRCIREMKDASHYLLVDDDAFINSKVVTDQIFWTHQGYDVIGRLTNSYKKDKGLVYLSGGAGILFTSGILDIFHNLDRQNFNDKWCDVILGKIFKSNNTVLLGNYSFHSLNPKKYGYDRFEIRNASTFHYVSPKEMYDLYKICY